MVLGRLDPDNFLGGEMKLDAEGARRGIDDKIAGPLRMDTIAAAQAILDIAIAKMSLAVRECRSRRAMIRAISRWSPRAAQARCT